MKIDGSIQSSYHPSGIPSQIKQKMLQEMQNLQTSFLKKDYTGSIQQIENLRVDVQNLANSRELDPDTVAKFNNYLWSMEHGVKSNFDSNEFQPSWNNMDGLLNWF